MSHSKGGSVINPESTIGILGGGQLGRMMTIAAKYMGYRVHVFSTTQDSPTGQVADREVVAPFEDLEAIAAFAKDVDVVTVETENIPVPTLDKAAEFCPAYPGRKTLATCQNRLIEKQFLVDNGIPTNDFRCIRSQADLDAACQQLMPAVLKSATGGYDGKGQYVIRDESDVAKAWDELGVEEAILESWIEYDFEFSVVGFRNAAGETTAYPSIRNEHVNGILDVSISPSGLSDAMNEAATQVVFRVLESLEAIGVLTVEFFARGDEVLVNEIAPRPHNSGHLTIEGHATSQFEQHIRAVCGMAAGSTKQIAPIAMANLLGRTWANGTPQWQKALAVADTKLHLYGKVGPKTERKMGHLTSFGDSVEHAREQVVQAREMLNGDA